MRRDGYGARSWLVHKNPENGLKAARLAIEFRGGAGKTEFLNDLKTQSAVLHQILVLGEAVKRLSPRFRETHPEVPWKLIAGSRDKLIHFYEGVDLDEVWKMLVSDLPELIRQIEPLASSQGSAD